MDERVVGMGDGGAADRAKRHKERSLDDYKRKIYRLRLELEQERLRCEQLRQQREHDARLLADRLAEEKAADAERVRLSLAKQHDDECEALRRAHGERERELGALLEAGSAEASRLRLELQRVAASEAKEALSSVHSETLSKLFRENKGLKQQIVDWQRKHEHKCHELKEKAAECEQAQKELERERQRMLRESLSFRLTKLKHEQQQQQQLPSPPSDGVGGAGSAASAAAAAAAFDSAPFARGGPAAAVAVASTDRERELQRKLAELSAIVQKLERRHESLKEENAQLKKRDEAARGVEEKLVKLKKRNGELAALAKKLDERCKQLQQQQQGGGLKKLQDAAAVAGAQSLGDLEHIKKVFARQRAKDLAEHAKSTLAKERELEALRRKCFALADAASNDSGVSSGGGGGSVRSAAELGDLAGLIRITAKERLHLEWLKSRDWDDGSYGGAAGLGDAGDNVASNGSGSRSGGRTTTAAAGAVEMLRSKLDSLLEENAALSRRADAALADCEVAREELRRQKEAAAAASDRAAAADVEQGRSAGRQAVAQRQQLPNESAVGESAALQSALADARAQVSRLHVECSTLAEKAKELESENAAVTLDHERQKREIERLEAAAVAAQEQLAVARLRPRVAERCDVAVQADIAIAAAAQALRSSGGTDVRDASSAAAAAAAAQIAELLRENSSLREDKQELLSALEENTDLKKELRALTAANKILRKDCEGVADLQKRLDVALLESESLRADAALGADRQRTAEAERAARAQADALALADALRDRADGERRCEQLRLDARQLEKECAALRATYASTQSMLADSIQHNGHLQQELGVERDKLAACAGELELCKNTVENVRAELESAKAALDDVQQQQRQQQQQQHVSDGCAAASGITCSKCGFALRLPGQAMHASVQTDLPDCLAAAVVPDDWRWDVGGAVGTPAAAVAASVAADPARSRCSAATSPQSRGRQQADCSSSDGAVLVRNGERVYQIYVAKCTYDPVCCSTGDDPTQELVVNAGDYVLVVDGQAEADDGSGFCDGLLLTGARGRVQLDILEPLGDLDPRLAAGAAAASLSSAALLLPPPLSVPAGVGSNRLADDGMPAERDYDSGTAVADQAAAAASSAAVAAAAAAAAAGSTSSVYGPLRVLASADASLLPCPQNLQLERQLSNSIVISWDAPDDVDGEHQRRHGHEFGTGKVETPAVGTMPSVYAYNVYVDGQFRLSVPASGKLKALVEGVRARVPHRVAVTAVGSRGESDTAQCTTVIGEPPVAPTAVRLLRVEPSSATVAFLPGDSNSVHAVLLDGQLVRNLRPGVCRFHVDGLEPGGQHSVTLAALPAADARPAALATGTLPTQLQTTFTLRTPGGGGSGGPSGSAKLVATGHGQWTPPSSARGALPISEGASPAAGLVVAAAAAALGAPRLSNGLSDSGSSEERWPTNSEQLPSAASAGRRRSDRKGSDGGHGGKATAVSAGRSPRAGRLHSRGSQTPSPRLYIALADYDPATSLAATHHPSEGIALKRGQVVNVFSDVSGDGVEGFLLGEVGSQRGYVPCSAVRELPIHSEVAEPPTTYGDGAESCGIGSTGAGNHCSDEDACGSPSAVLPPAQRVDARATGGDSRAGTSISSSRGGSVMMATTVTTRKMMALYDYDPQQCSPNVDADLELAFRAGDVITVLGEMDEDGFYHGLLDGRTGLVPSNYLQH